MRLGLVAEHEAFIRYPGSKDWLSKCESTDMNWKEHIESGLRGDGSGLVHRKECYCLGMYCLRHAP